MSGLADILKALAPLGLTSERIYFRGDCLLLQADCLDVLPLLPSGCVDACLVDPPYGTTQNAWDEEISLHQLWPLLASCCRGAVVVTAAQPFTSVLIQSNRDDFRYAMVWDKVNKYTDFLNANKRPMRRHEDIVVFAAGEHTYNPQMEPVRAYKSRRSQPSRTTSYGQVNGCDYGAEITTHGPCSVVCIEAAATTGIVHPTQKPVGLMVYLAKTYSNTGDVILDFAAGSGTTAIACIQTGRKFIGSELDEGHFRTACRRLDTEFERLALLEPPPPRIEQAELFQ